MNIYTSTAWKHVARVPEALTTIKIFSCPRDLISSRSANTVSINSEAMWGRSGRPSISLASLRGFLTRSCSKKVGCTEVETCLVSSTISRQSSVRNLEVRGRPMRRKVISRQTCMNSRFVWKKASISNIQIPERLDALWPRGPSLCQHEACLLLVWSLDSAGCLGRWPYELARHFFGMRSSVDQVSGERYNPWRMYTIMKPLACCTGQQLDQSLRPEAILALLDDR